jgi:hypothetical protein
MNKKDIHTNHSIRATGATILGRNCSMAQIRDFTVIGAILDRGQKSERKQYGADLMKAQFEECKM